MVIIVNGEEKEYSGIEISYFDLVSISGLPYNDYYTVTFYKRENKHTVFSGILMPREAVKVSERMRFSIFLTNNA